MRWLLVVLVALPVAYGGLLYAAGEYGGEVVTLSTAEPDGRRYETPLWIVEDGRTLWLRAGSEESRWYQRVRANPEVELQRGDRVLQFRAVPVPEYTERVNELMAERYGLADRLIDFFARGDDSVAVRLDTRG